MELRRVSALLVVAVACLLLMQTAEAKKKRRKKPKVSHDAKHCALPLSSSFERPTRPRPRLPVDSCPRIPSSISNDGETYIMYVSNRRIDLQYTPASQI